MEKSVSIFGSNDSAATAFDTDVPPHESTLTLAMLGCETNLPYGPLNHTAQLLLELLIMAAVHAGSAHSKEHFVICLHVYNATDMEYPNSWENYDGILIPGSFSSAYDQDPWIERLKVVIQEHIVLPHRPTLAICFGHQIMAHSFSLNRGGGFAAPTPSGPRAGRFEMPLYPAGKALFINDPILSSANIRSDAQSGVQLYFTHGDMVRHLPDVAVSLGGDVNVPIQAAAYFSTLEDARRYQNRPDTNVFDEDCSHAVLPYAITLQAHPEYSTSIDGGLHRTLFQCMDAMEQRRAQCNILPREDAIDHFALVQDQSIALVARIGQVLGWFH